MLNQINSNFQPNKGGFSNKFYVTDISANEAQKYA